YPRAEAYAILSMAQYKLGTTNAAQRALADCDQVIHDKLPPAGTYLGQDWPDWIIAHSLQSEAIQTAAERLPADQPNALPLCEVLNWEAEARKYAEDGKANEAEAAFKKSLAIRKQYLNNEPPGSFTILAIINCLVEHAQPNDAAELLNRSVTP